MVHQNHHTVCTRSQSISLASVSIPVMIAACTRAKRIRRKHASPDRAPSFHAALKKSPTENEEHTVNNKSSLAKETIKKREGVGEGGGWRIDFGFQLSYTNKQRPPETSEQFSGDQLRGVTST